MMKVEIQFRTIAMDFWASLEHQLKYKQSITNEDEIVRKLKDCAEIIAKVDSDMQTIRSDIEENSTEKEASPFDKLEKISFGNFNNL